MVMQAMAKLHAVGYREDDVYLHCAPLFHIGGLSSMLAMLAVGATQVRVHCWLHCALMTLPTLRSFSASWYEIVPCFRTCWKPHIVKGMVHLQVFQPAFNAAGTLSLVRHHSVTSLIAVPAMVVSLHEAAQADQLTQPSQAVAPSGSATDQQFSKARSSRRRVSSLAAYPSVRVVLLGGGELPARLKGPLQALFPSAHLYTAYGMTEACSSMTFGSLDMRPSTAPSFCSSQAATGPAAAADSTAGSGAPLGKAAHQSPSGDMARSGSEAGRHESRSSAGAIPVGMASPWH